MKNSKSKNDALLLDKIKNGDTKSTRILVDQNLNIIINYSTKMLGDRSEAEDVAQEAFLRLWQNLDKWRADAPVIHWLQRVTYNLCIDLLRKKKTLNIDSVKEPENPFENPAESLYQDQLSSKINEAIQKLPERQRAAIIFSHQQGFNNIETAQAMDISIEAVESLLSRGRRQLRILLEGLKQEIKETHH